MTTVAIMQPYFIPYAGYFRLFAGSDLFVIYDCVQFPRRGWVHRNHLFNAEGAEDWLTLPLQRAPQNTLIRDLRFVTDAKKVLSRRLQRFPLVPKDPMIVEPILAALRDVDDTPLAYIERLLEVLVRHCGLEWRVVRSSSLNIPTDFKGQDRILAIARQVGATAYLNASGGRELYQEHTFTRAGLALRFLPPYPGPSTSILTRVLQETPDDLKRDIVGSL